MKSAVTDPDDHFPDPTGRNSSDAGGSEYPPRREWLGRVLVGLKYALLAGVACGIWWVVDRLLRTDASGIGRVIVTSALMGAVVLSILWQEFRWLLPRHRFLRLLSEARKGRMPIDAMNEVGGSLRGVADAVGELLHHTRSLERRIAEQEIEMTQKVANRTEALQRQLGSLRLAAIRDSLTGLYNRRALDTLLPKLLDLCQAKSEDLSLLALDVDYFKQLNDQLGHAAGDELLRSIGQLIRSTLARTADAGFRCGGDEFIIVLPACPPHVAQRIATRLSSLVDQLAKTVRSEPKVGLSVGVCSISDLSEPSTSSLLREADNRLYETKRRHHRQPKSAA